MRSCAYRLQVECLIAAQTCPGQLFTRKRRGFITGRIDAGERSEHSHAQSWKMSIPILCSPNVDSESNQTYSQISDFAYPDTRVLPGFRETIGARDGIPLQGGV